MSELPVILHQLDRIEAKVDNQALQIERQNFRGSFWGAVSGAMTALLYLLLSAFMGGCLPQGDVRFPYQEDLLGSTVALVEGEDARVYCAGAHLGDGHVLTAAHCVTDDYGLVATTLSLQGVEEDGTLAAHTATVQRVNQLQDLALLQIADGYRPRSSLEMGDRTPWVGELIFACGHPYGLSYTITRGEVSFVRRNDDGMIWTQADITVDPGNSGGPVVDEDGNLVAIVSFKIGRQAGLASLESIYNLLSER